MSLRIAYMTGEYPRATDTFIQREVAALRERGVHVETFSVRKPHDRETIGPEQQQEREQTCYLLPASALDLIRSHLSLLIGTPSRYFSVLAMALRVRPPGMKALIWQIAYFAEAALVARRMRGRGLVHLHNHFSNSSCSVAMLAAQLGGFTFSFTMHGPAEFFEPKYWRIDEKIRRAKFVCCISYFCRSQGMIFAPPGQWGKMHVVHCGVDPAAYRPARHSGRGRRVLFVGRLAPVKGLPVLLEAIARLCQDDPAIQLSIVGDGPDRAALEAQARSLGISSNVRFLGCQSQAQVRELLAGTDVFAMSSFAEGVPVVLMEAMAAGVPVVATRIAGIPELVVEGAGFLGNPGDSQALAQRVRELLDDPDLRNAFAAAGRRIVEEEFNLSTESARLCHILTEALAGRATPVRPDVASVAEPQRAAPAMSSALS